MWVKESWACVYCPTDLYPLGSAGYCVACGWEDEFKTGGAFFGRVGKDCVDLGSSRRVTVVPGKVGFKEFGYCVYYNTGSEVRDINCYVIHGLGNYCVVIALYCDVQAVVSKTVAVGSGFGGYR